MGIDIDKSSFAESDYRDFEKKLQTNLSSLSSLLSQTGFGKKKPGSAILGAELEMYIVDSKGEPLLLNQEILDAADDKQLTLEINRYNLEYNLTPYSLSDAPFKSTENEICRQLSKLNDIAAKYEGRIFPVGILPTLDNSHFGPVCMTDRQRYRTLVEQLFERRGREFEIDINGRPPLQMDMQDVTLEGANTSFQIHYRVDPEDYANTFNAFQMVTPLVLALGANSPGLFGHDLWCETRVPLFKQSIDTRIKDRYRWNEPSRVSFGQGWVRRSALELFQETASIFSPLLPICSEQDPEAQMAEGKAPSLSELRLHQSSVWLWNRPVYDDADEGHLRIELRSLPAGPSAVDMVANAALYIGLAEYYRDKMNELMPALPFHLAEFNFYRAAQFGLGARIVWPDPQRSGCRDQPIIDILSQSIDHAEQGLRSIGVEDEEAGYYLSIVKKRLESKQNGAVWQRERTAYYQNEKSYSSDKARKAMLEDYIAYSLDNIPVGEWPLT
ncbi:MULTISPECIES: glutamate--cysteine ligase [unclassified Oleiphilus]|jgi:gamma-glutamyl:cysteine ligase YbdK (ATP-grasp superfamily)|uniref:glutamate--cysteine ligase n=1 Tax=unclassified Oleiphilus TaxID=2631174 RepID=UPI0007C34253|nr:MULTISPECIES: glutamate--cysteine ligase [unclassified Oleiphilus]KZY45730.1 glutamate--cysteine ligase [Oleiphilus sp. HI0050]KZY76978.1 glutamate--cysteine ligase [Oleiphilus sp. HI0069]KZY95379.1 glutamate--cysteine ligase [Oleiphilus sp. HI0072]KZZ10993.1 glutamate--cysteine ligase [Oleiphilus sp. HI0078]KZZ19424.1 glutamate--cysteine ligase [Oleiphilus sp. HI0081]KZZ30839.1 glutamate--cysteine ligase [Oleiphilus sp. HI0085]